MGTVRGTTEHYLYAVEQKWDELIKRYDVEKEKVLFPLTFCGDNALHMAVHSRRGAYPISELLEWAEEYTPLLEEDEEGSNRKKINDYMLKDAYGNTVLHDAAVAGNLEVVELLVGKYPELQTIENHFGESPLFRAASFGQTKIVKFLAKPDQFENTSSKPLLPVHRYADHRKARTVEDETSSEDEKVSKDGIGTSILHNTIQGEFFETALELLKLDRGLADAELKDRWDETALHRLSNMKSAFKSGSPMGLFKNLLYTCLPVYIEADDPKPEEGGGQLRDLESNQRNESRNRFTEIRKVFKRVHLSVCSCLFEGWPAIEKIWNEKKKHKYALNVAEILIKDDISWSQVVCLSKIKHSKSTRVLISENVSANMKTSHNSVDHYDISNAAMERRAPEPPLYEPAIFTAARNGLIEIIRLFIKEHPQAIEHINEHGQNIFHIAVMHRQKAIFLLLKEMVWPTTRLAHVIDSNGYTLLHHVADTQYYDGGIKPGPALKLQEELMWFELVADIVPDYYKMHREYEGKKTAKEIFDKKHATQLKEAQEWVKGTAESYSLVSVLVATVVFAAAYTVPGGSEKGVPILINSSYFLIFTVMDVIALGSSLTAVVIFLSILTSTWEQEEFRHSIPQKLTFGLTLLFISVITTMIAFGATVLLTVRPGSGNKWTTSLVSIAAFCPVSIFALLQFHLYVWFLGTFCDFLRSIQKAFPSWSWFLPRCLYKKKLHN